MSGILIVDDTAFMRLMIKEIVTTNGMEVVGEAANGDEAVKKYFELKPDLVTMDITMPEKDGLSALREILERDSEAKVIMCSAVGSQITVLDAIKAGARDFIVKPFKAERVLEAIKKTLDPEEPES